MIEKYIKKDWSYNDFLVISFGHKRVYKIREINPKIKLGLLFKKPTKELLQNKKDLTGIGYLILNYKNIDKRFVDLMHEKGIKVFVYTVNKKDDIKKVKSFGIDGIVSDYPNRI